MGPALAKSHRVGSGRELVTVMSSKFSDADRQRILAESRATLARGLEDHPNMVAALDDPPVNEDTYVRSEPRVESLNERHRREITETEARFEIERERERVKRESAEQKHAEVAANAAAVQRIAELEAEVLEVARATGTVCEALENELARVTRENTELKLAQAKLETRLAELQLNAAPDRSNSVIDLSPPHVN